MAGAKRPGGAAHLNSSMQGEGRRVGFLFHVSWRYLLSRRWQSLLMILGIALGVAVVISIDLANASASKAFELSTETVAGRTTDQITAGPEGIDDQVYTRLRLEKPGIVAAPVISEYVDLDVPSAPPMQLLGIDPFSDAPFRSFLTQPQPGASRSADVGALASFFTQPGAVLLSQDVAARYGLKVGGTVEILTGGKQQRLTVAGLLKPDNALTARTLDGLILADISTAQELTGMQGRLSRIDLILPEDPALRQGLQAWLPKGCLLEPAASRSGSIKEMTSAFQLNLSALSLLALVVGLFLIYDTMTFSVVQRRGLFGTLRCLGVTRREIFILVLSEACVVGLLGGLLGIGLGILLGRVTVGMVMQTVNDLYFTTTVRPQGVDALSLVKGAGLGLLASVLTAALPAYEASTVPPRSALLRSGLESKARAGAWRSALFGLGAAVAGISLFAWPSTSLALGFGGTLLVVLAAALLSSASLAGLMRIANPITGRLFGFIGRMAPRDLVAALSRTSVAVAALMVAVAVIIGVALMIDSFRYTVVVWLAQTLQGDVYISVPSVNATHPSAPIDPRVIDLLRAFPGIKSFDTLRTGQVDARAGSKLLGQVTVQATDNQNIARERMLKGVGRPKDQVWSALLQGAVLVSEPLANRIGIQRLPASLDLYTPSGWRAFTVVGIYYDYSSSQGTLYMAQPFYRSLWPDTGLTAISIRVTPGTSPDALAQRLQNAAGSIQSLLIRPNAALRSDVMAVFDRTFAITVALRLLATVVAFIGVLNALLLLQLERQREVGILRALGLTGRQLWALVMVETGLMGLVSGLLAMPTGYALALILVYIINKRSFGWTLQMVAAPEVFLQALAVALAAALLAGIYPALKLGRMKAAEAIRYE